ncbi:hypothetical protein C8R46DRAFT_1233210 [Mycena filopes]|nr:hypothetical protein C8R46DRAFT_1233210 [Mycena filopes]
MDAGVANISEWPDDETFLGWVEGPPTWNEKGELVTYLFWSHPQDRWWRLSMQWCRGTRLQAPAQWYGDGVPEWEAVRAKMDSPAYGVGASPHSAIFWTANPSKEQDAVLSDIRRWRTIGEVRREEYHAEVDRLEEELRLAKLRAAHADTIMRGSLSPLSAILGIPEELWLKILTLVKAYDNAPTWGSSPRPWGSKVTPATLRLVCRAFNRLLTSTDVAMLWNPVLLPVRGSSGWGSGWASEGATKAIAKVAVSGDKLPELRYLRFARWREINFSMEVMDVETLQEVLKMESWNVMHIRDFYSWQGQQRLGSLLRVREMPRIETLQIEDIWENGRLMEHQAPRDGFAEDGELFGNRRLLRVRSPLQFLMPAASELRGVVLVRTMEPDVDFQLPWSTLQTYAEFRTVRKAHLPLSHLERMTAMTVLCLGSVEIEEMVTERLSLPQLREFYYMVGWPRRGEPCRAFASLDFPGLEVLRVKTDERTSTSDEDAASVKIHKDLEKFLTRCPVLKVLELALGVPYTAKQLLRHLRACGNLEVLEVTVCHAQIFVPELFEGLKDVRLVPRLQVLRLPQLPGPDTWRAVTKREEGFVSMLEARFAGQLKTIDLREAEDMGHEEGSWTEAAERWAKAAYWNVIPEAYSGWTLGERVWGELNVLGRTHGWNVVTGTRWGRGWVAENSDTADTGSMQL